jgi:hypothetical protein
MEPHFAAVEASVAEHCGDCLTSIPTPAGRWCPLYSARAHPLGCRGRVTPEMRDAMLTRIGLEPLGGSA